jgi:coenzyme F420-0:L-glutamate ligase / coenzyme F420-1:gamma-L-glutamate ligase
MLSVIPLTGLPEIRPGDNLAALLAARIERQDIVIRPGDVLVITSKIISKAEGAQASLSQVEPTDNAQRISVVTLKDPRLVELVLRESTEIIRAAPHVLITRHRSGHVMANAGIDASNSGSAREDQVLLLPSDADASALAISDFLESRLGYAIGVVISDSFGRPWRMGTVNVAVGVAGMVALTDQRGETDRDGRVLQVTQVAVADALAAAAGLVMGETIEGIPAVIIRGFNSSGPAQNSNVLVRPIEQDLFR